MFVSMLTPTRETWLFTASVTTGKPIHREWQVVVVPLKGNGSSAISAWWCKARNSRNGNLPCNSRREESTPWAANIPHTRSRVRPAGSVASSSLAPGTADTIMDQACTTCGVSLGNALNEPKRTEERRGGEEG